MAGSQMDAGPAKAPAAPAGEPPVDVTHTGANFNVVNRPATPEDVPERAGLPGQFGEAKSRIGQALGQPGRDVSQVMQGMGPWGRTGLYAAGLGAAGLGAHDWATEGGTFNLFDREGVKKDKREEYQKELEVKRLNRQRELQEARGAAGLDPMTGRAAVAGAGGAGGARPGQDWQARTLARNMAKRILDNPMSQADPRTYLAATEGIGRSPYPSSYENAFQVAQPQLMDAIAAEAKARNVSYKPEDLYGNVMHRNVPLNMPEIRR
jgi:hypothetical protein